MQSDRLLRLPPYLFVEIDRRKAEYVGSGGRVLDLGIGDPDLGAPAIVIERLKEALGVISHHRYPPGTGLPMLKSAIRDWAGREYGVAPGDDEILVTIGSKEAIAHLPLATVDPGSMVLVPDPGYPVYHSSAVFAGADSHRMPLTEVNGFLPEFSGLDADVRKKARLVYLNYPNNPTAATAGPGFFEEAIGFSRETGSILVNDAAYSGIVFEGKAEALFPAAIEAGIEYAELFSFSKTLSITGWRVGFAIGSPAVISALGRFKANVDSGVFSAIQEAIARVLDEDYEQVTGEIMSVYRERRDILADGLRRGGFRFMRPDATFYFWIPVPGGAGSIDFCGKLLEETGIVATPGVGFGECGEGFFRLSLTAPTDIIGEASEKLAGYR